MRHALLLLAAAVLVLRSGEGGAQQRPNPGDTASTLDAGRVAAWRALKKRPPLPPEANRNRVLAENAVQEKRYEDAVRYYEAGLAIEPLWPEGQYNAALLQGELGNFAGAARHGHAYLELEPAAQDAQAMEEKIIIWEEKAKHPPPPPPPDPSTYAHFGIGDHVRCNSSGTVYDGWVDAQSLNRVTVNYYIDVVDQTTADKCQLVAGVSSFPIIEIGDHVSCNWRSHGTFYAAKVLDRQGGLVTVQYDLDHVREKITADMCRRD